LHIAVASGHKRVVERLLLAGVNANLVNTRSQESVMHVVARAGAGELAQVLRPFVSEETLEVVAAEGKRAWEMACDNKIGRAHV
jgi:hypothetical protein